jgi:hypothetical protein
MFEEFNVCLKKLLSVENPFAVLNLTLFLRLSVSSVLVWRVSGVKFKTIFRFERFSSRGCHEWEVSFRLCLFGDNNNKEWRGKCNFRSHGCIRFPASDETSSLSLSATCLRRFPSARAAEKIKLWMSHIQWNSWNVESSHKVGDASSGMKPPQPFVCDDCRLCVSSLIMNIFGWFLFVRLRTRSIGDTTSFFVL